MLVELDIFSLLDIVACATAYMLGLLFLTIKSNNKKANIFLSFFLFSLGTEILDSFLDSFTEQEFWIIQTSSLTITFLLFYVLFTINKKHGKSLILLFIPGFLQNTIFLFPNFEFHEGFKYFEYIFNISLLLVLLYILKNHLKKAFQHFSNLEQKGMRWIKTIVFIFLGFHALWIIEDLFSLQSEDISNIFALVSNILTFILVYWLGYNGFTQSEIFKEQLFSSVNIKQVEVNYSEHNTLEFKNIENLIRNNKYYTNPDLNLRMLSSLIQVKEKELSKLINTNTSNNFYHFINNYRIIEFTNLLNSEKSDQLSIWGLAQEAGFASKSTFYSAFKAKNGITPKQYKAKLKKSE